MRKDVLRQHLEPIHRLGEARLRRSRGFELLPPAAQHRGEVGRQHAKQSVGRRRFSLGFVAPARRVVPERVTRVNLDEVVNGQQGEDVPEVNVAGGEIPMEEKREEAGVPGMIGVGLQALPVVR